MVTLLYVPPLISFARNLKSITERMEGMAQISLFCRTFWIGWNILDARSRGNLPGPIYWIPSSCCICPLGNLSDRKPICKGLGWLRLPCNVKYMIILQKIKIHIIYISISQSKFKRAPITLSETGKAVDGRSKLISKTNSDRFPANPTDFDRFCPILPQQSSTFLVKRRTTADPCQTTDLDPFST